MAVLGSKVALAVQEAGCGDAKAHGNAVLNLPVAVSDNLAAADILARRQSQPRDKVVFGREGTQVGADLSHEGLSCHDINAVDAGQIDAGNARQFRLDVVGGGVPFRFRFFGRTLGFCGLPGF